MFYILGSQELQPKKPMWPPSSPFNCPPLTSSCRPKFLTVKFVIFFSFWQSVVLAILAHYVSSLLAAVYIDIYIHTHTHILNAVSTFAAGCLSRDAVLGAPTCLALHHLAYLTRRTPHIAHLTLLSSLCSRSRTSLPAFRIS